MNVENGWSQYFNLLTHFGIVPVSINKAGNVVSTKRDKLIYFRMFIILSVVNILLICNCLRNYWTYSSYKSLSKTAFQYEFLQEILSGCIFATNQIWMWSTYEDNVRTLRIILESDKRTRYCITDVRNWTSSFPTHRYLYWHLQILISSTLCKLFNICWGSSSSPRSCRFIQ